MWASSTKELFVLDILDDQINIFSEKSEHEMSIRSKTPQSLIADFHYEDSIQRVIFYSKARSGLEKWVTFFLGSKR